MSCIESPDNPVLSAESEDAAEVICDCNPEVAEERDAAALLAVVDMAALVDAERASIRWLRERFAAPIIDDRSWRRLLRSFMVARGTAGPRAFPWVSVQRTFTECPL